MIQIDLEKDEVAVEKNGVRQVYGIGTPEAFNIISKAWLRSGWDTKYVYSFTWLGRPLIQLPEDVLRVQEVIHTVKPDVIIETGIAHGGSLVFHASLCKAMNKGRIIGIDIEIRPHNRKAIEEHELYKEGYITMIEGDSIADEVIEQVKQLVKPGERGLVILDGNHSRDHVFKELERYSQFVALDSYIIAEDGIREMLVGAPRSEPDWAWDHPKQATLDFVKERKEFEIVEPVFQFNEGAVTERVSYWPSAYVKRIQ